MFWKILSLEVYESYNNYFTKSNIKGHKEIHFFLLSDHAYLKRILIYFYIKNEVIILNL